MNKTHAAVMLVLGVLGASAVHGQTPPAEPTPPPGQPPAEAPPPAPTPPPAWKDKLYFGGGVGASFGDIDYVELAPLVGYRLHPRVATGVRLFYRWKSDDRYANSVSTSDYGGNLFMNLSVFGPWFGAVEYEYVDYEYATPLGATFRESDSNLLAGVGFSRRAGGRAGLYATALYNFSYDDNDPFEPYDSPWVYRVGVTFGF
jgi:hypothetical protein